MPTPVKARDREEGEETDVWWILILSVYYLASHCFLIKGDEALRTEQHAETHSSVSVH